MLSTFKSSASSIIKASDRTKLEFWSGERSNMLRSYELNKSILLHNRILSFYPHKYSSHGSIIILDLETLVYSLHRLTGESVLFKYINDCSICIDRENQVVIYGRLGVGSLGSALEIFSFKDSNGIEIKWKLIKKYSQPTTVPLLDNHTANIYKNLMYIFAGGKQSELYAYNFDEDQWIKCLWNGRSPDLLKDHASIIVLDKLYIYDGRRDDHCQEIWYWDLKLHTWKDATPQRGLLPTFIKGGSLNLLGDNHILVYGGENCKDLVYYDIKKQEWGSYQTEKEFHLDGDTDLVAFYQDKMIFGNEYEIYSVNLSFLTNSIKANVESSLGSDLQAMFQDKQLSDVCFQVEGKEISAHKAFLVSRCPYFKRMFASGMKESQEKVIVVPNLKYTIFSKLLEYLYCDKVELDEETAVELLKLSDEYSMNSLKGFCERFLVEKVSRKNVISFAILAEQYAVNELRNGVVEALFFLKSRLTEDEISILPKSILEDIVIRKF